ncbi:unnamed protein product, partial [Polarella glacialis]
LQSLAGEWRLFFDTGAVRNLLIRPAPGRDAEMTAEASPWRPGGRQLPSSALVRDFERGYTEVIAELLLPAILGAESDDDDPVLRRYRVRARFCKQNAVMQAFDKDDGRGDLRWSLRTAIAIRGAAAADIPLVAPMALLSRAFEATALSSLWNLAQLAWNFGLQHNSGNLALAPSARPIGVGRGNGGRPIPLCLVRESWRHRLVYADHTGTCEGQRHLTSAERPTLWSTLVTFGAPTSEAWDAVAPGGLLLGPCAAADQQAESFAAEKADQVLGFVHFGGGCYYLLYKPDWTSPRKPGLSTWTRLLPGPRNSQGFIMPVLKTRGVSGVGVRLGNALFTIAAAISFANDNGMSLRLTHTEPWQKYYQRGGMLSQLPGSMWYIRSTDADQLLGSPAEMGYEAPVLEAGARTVLMHGYFQNVRYFWHNVDLVRRLLMPHDLLQAARRVWEPHASEAIAVHVRLGDKEGLGEAYYRNAASLVSRRLWRSAGATLL